MHGRNVAHSRAGDDAVFAAHPGVELCGATPESSPTVAVSPRPHAQPQATNSLLRAREPTFQLLFAAKCPAPRVIQYERQVLVGSLDRIWGYACYNTAGWDPTPP